MDEKGEPTTSKTSKEKHAGSQGSYSPEEGNTCTNAQNTVPPISNLPTIGRMIHPVSFDLEKNPCLNPSHLPIQSPPPRASVSLKTTQKKVGATPLKIKERQNLRTQAAERRNAILQGTHNDTSPLTGFIPFTNHKNPLDTRIPTKVTPNIKQATNTQSIQDDHPIPHPQIP